MRHAVVFWVMMMAASPVLAEDAREPALRNEAERTFILGQMRGFLESTQAITAALAVGDLKTVAEEAASRGKKGPWLATIPPGMRAKETPAWSAMMGGTRGGFDEIAAAAQEGASPATLMRMLGATMQNCIACHQTYRLAAE